VMSGNPNCIELLFIATANQSGHNSISTPILLWEGEEWMRLKQERNLILSQRTFDRTVGFVKGFLKKQASKKPSKKKGKQSKQEREKEAETKEEKDEEWPSNVLRICEFLVTFRESFMRRKGSEGKGEDNKACTTSPLGAPLDQRRQQIEELIKEIENAYEWTSLPPTEEEVLDKLNSWVQTSKAALLHEEIK